MRCLLVLFHFSFLILFTSFLYCNDAHSLTWENLRQLNYETGEMPESLLKYDQKLVQVEGFIVPLEMDEYMNSVTEFFLVPDPMACIHVPPPPPNQIIYVKMNHSIPLDMDYRGISITGILRFITSSDGIHGYDMDGVSAEEADIEYEDPLMNIINN